MRYRYVCGLGWEGGIAPATKGRPQDGVPRPMRDRYGRGEFLVKGKDGRQRITSGWRDWRNHCKQNGLVEVDPKDRSLRKNTAYEKAQAKLKAALPKAVESAIHQVKHKPYFDKRVTGMYGKPTLNELKKEFRKKT